MRKKDDNHEARTVTVGVLVTPKVAEVLRKVAKAEDRSLSSLTHRFLMESPSFRRAIKESASA